MEETIEQLEQRAIINGHKQAIEKLEKTLVELKILHRSIDTDDVSEALANAMIQTELELLSTIRRSKELYSVITGEKQT
jgi:hypothetical protein